MDASGHGVGVVGDGVVVDGVVAQVGAFGQPSAEQPVGVLVGGSLPGRVRVAEEHGDGESGLELVSVGHFASLVPGERAV